MLDIGTAVGSSHLVEFLTDFTKKVYEAASDDVRVLLSTGNTDAWAKVTSLLLNSRGSVFGLQMDIYDYAGRESITP